MGRTSSLSKNSKIVYSFIIVVVVVSAGWMYNNNQQANNNQTAVTQVLSGTYSVENMRFVAKFGEDSNSVEFDTIKFNGDRASLVEHDDAINAADDENTSSKTLTTIPYQIENNNVIFNYMGQKYKANLDDNRSSFILKVYMKKDDSESKFASFQKQNTN